MDSACPEKDATEILSDSDHSTKVAPATWTRNFVVAMSPFRVAVISAKKHKRQRRKRQSVTAKREKSQTPNVLTAIPTLPNLT